MIPPRAPGFADIKPLMLAELPRLVRELAPAGQRKGGYWIAKNPTRNDKHAGSFWVRLEEPAKGSWRDEATPDKGDVFGLVEYVLGHADRRDTLAWCRRWLGLDRADPADRQRLEARRQAAAAEQQRQERTASEQAVQNANRAFALWLKAEKNLMGSPIDLYLRGRGIHIEQLARPPRAIRWLRDQEHQSADGELTRCQVMIAAMTNAAGQTKAVHRTFLVPDDRRAAPQPYGKITDVLGPDYAPARKIWPSFKGCAIRLARGAGGFTEREAIERQLHQVLLLCEGVEDGLALALACPDHRVWAVGSLGNLSAIAVPACASRIIVAADNDWGKPQAEAALEKALAHLRTFGRPVTVARSWHGKDANDLLRSNPAAKQEQ